MFPHRLCTGQNVHDANNHAVYKDIRGCLLCIGVLVTMSTCAPEPSTPPVLPARCTVQSLPTVASYHLPGFVATTSASADGGSVVNELVVRNYHAAAGPRGTTVIVGSGTYIATGTQEGYIAVFNAAGTLLFNVALIQVIGTGTSAVVNHVSQPAHVSVFHDYAIIAGRGVVVPYESTTTSGPALARVNLATYATSPPGTLVPFLDPTDHTTMSTGTGMYTAVCSGGSGVGFCECSACTSTLPPALWVVGTVGGRHNAASLTKVGTDLLQSSESTLVTNVGSTTSHAVDATFTRGGLIAILCSCSTGVAFLWLMNPDDISTTIGIVPVGNVVPLRLRVDPTTGNLVVLAFGVRSFSYEEPVLFTFSPDGTTLLYSSSSLTFLTAGYVPTDMTIAPVPGSGGVPVIIVVGNVVGAALLNQPNPDSLTTALVSSAASPWCSGFIDLPVSGQWVWTAHVVGLGSVFSLPLAAVDPPLGADGTDVRWVTALVGSGHSLRAVGDFTTFNAVQNMSMQPASVVIMSVLQALPTTSTPPARSGVDVDPAGLVTVDCTPAPTTLAVNGSANILGSVALGGTLTASGGVVVGNTTAATPGTIRFNGTNFQGFNGTSWVTLG